MLPGLFATIDDIRQAHRDAGGHYFDTDTMRFFRARVSDTVYAGRMFVDSISDYSGTRREYRVSVLTHDMRGVSRVRDVDGTPCEYDTSRAAHAAAARLCKLASVAPYSVDVAPPIIALAERAARLISTMSWNVTGVHAGAFSDVVSYDRGVARFTARKDSADGVHMSAYVNVTEADQTVDVSAYVPGARTDGARLSARIPTLRGANDFVDAFARTADAAYTLAHKTGHGAGVPNGAA